jgi:hypothetical protein
MVPEPFRRYVETGLSFFVGTVDAEGFPAACRAYALRSNDDFSVVTVYVPVNVSQETIANVATTRRVAIGATHPIDHGSIQIKGTTRGVRLARPEEEAFVQKRLEEYTDLLDMIGVPRRIMRGVTHWPAFAIDVTVEELFDQTPGPRAGEPIR